METNKEYVVPIDKKEWNIYKRKKNRRIKNKQEKKSSLIEVRELLAKEILKAYKKETKIYINGEEVEWNKKNYKRSHYMK